MTSEGTMPELVFKLNLEDGNFSGTLNVKKEDLKKFAGAFDDTGDVIENSLEGLERKLANLNEEFRRAELGSDEFEKLKKEVKLAGDELKKAEKFVGDIEERAENTKSVMSQWGNIVTGFNQALELAGKAWDVLSKPLNTSAGFEKLNVEFEVLLGSVSESIKMVEDIVELGAKTPLQLIDLQTNAKLMLSFGIEAEKILPTLKTIGDISSGDTQKLSSLTLAFSQMSSAGKLTGQDLLQMINAGFNPLQVISEKTHKTIGQLRKEMEKGAITSDMVADAFTTATSEGGKFHNMMERQSATYNGMVSNLEDSISLMNKAIGDKLFPLAKDTVMAVKNIVSAITSMFVETETEVDKLNKQFEQQRFQFIELSNQYIVLAEKTNKTNEEQSLLKETIDDLNKLYPNYLTNVNLEKDSIDKVKTAFQEARVELEKYFEQKIQLALLQERENEIVEIGKKIAEYERAKIRFEAMVRTARETLTFNGIKYGSLEEVNKVIDFYKTNDEFMKNYIESLKKSKEDLLVETKAIKEATKDLFTPPVDEESGDGKPTITPGLSDEEIKKEMALQKQRTEVYELSYEDYKKYLEKRLTTLKNNTDAEKAIVLQFKEELIKVSDKIKTMKPEVTIDAPEDSEFLKLATLEEVSQMRAQALENRYDREYALLELWKEKELTKYEKDLKYKEAIEDAYRARKEQLDEAVATAQLNATKKALSSMAGMFNKNTAAYKILAGTVALINTYQASAAALAPPPTGYGPALGLAMIPFIVAQGLAQVATIKEIPTQKMPGYKRGGIVVGDGGMEIISPAQDYATGHAQIMAMTILAVKNKLDSIGFNENNYGGKNELVSMMNEFREFRLRFEKWIESPIHAAVTDEANKEMWRRGQQYYRGSRG